MPLSKRNVAAAVSSTGSPSAAEDIAADTDFGSPNIQLSAALHPTQSDVPAEAMLDPVANTLDLREPFDKQRAARVLAAMKSTGVGLADIGYFDNMLVADEAARRKKHEFMLRVFDAAVLLGTDAVCGFVGRNPQQVQTAGQESRRSRSSNMDIDGDIP